MEPRLLHTADVHLGRRFEYLGELAPEHMERVGRTFRRVCELSKEQDCHLLVIAGDLFDSPRVERRWVRHALDLLSGTGIPVCVLPGNHDPAPTHPFQNEALPSNLYYLPECKTRLLPQLDLLLLACPPEQKSRWASRLKRDPQGPPFQIALVHGSLPTPGHEGDLTSQTIVGSNLDYIALGDWHSLRDCSSGGVTAWYSGAPEMVMPDQQLPGHALLITLKADGKRNRCFVQPLPVGESRFLEDQPTFELDVNRYSDRNALLESLRARLTTTTVARILLTGRWHSQEPLDLEELENALSPLCLYLRLEARLQTEPPEPETPFEKTFAALVHRRMEAEPAQSDLYQDVLSLGLYLLRGGRL